MHFLALAALFFAPGAFADVSRCAKVEAEAAELRSSRPGTCDEARETHETYVKGFPEAAELCRKLAAQAEAGAPRLKLGTEDEMQKEAMELRQRHITERAEITDRVIKELFPTPLDNNDPARPPPTVDSDCGTEIEAHVRFRRNLLRGVSEFFGKIERYDDQLLQQAAERALPSPAPAPVKHVR